MLSIFTSRIILELVEACKVREYLMTSTHTCTTKQYKLKGCNWGDGYLKKGVITF